MPQHINLVHQAFTEQNTSAQNAYAFATEVFQRDALDNDFRALPPVILTGVCGASDETGMCVYLASASGGVMTFAKAVPADPTKMAAVGIIVYKPTSTSCVVRPFACLGEVTLTGLTAGTTYVVGSDGLVAKFGGANYPSAGSVIQVIGKAISTTLLLIDPALAAAGDGGSAEYVLTAASSALTASSTETTMGSYNIEANTLRAGSIIDVEWAGICTATNAADTFTQKLYLGAGADMLSIAALDVANNDIFTGRVSISVRSTTAAFPRGEGFLGTPGTAAFKPISHTALVHDATIDQLVKFTGTWSSNNAGNSARLDVFRVKVKR